MRHQTCSAILKGRHFPGLPPNFRPAPLDHIYEKSNKAAKGKNIARCPSVAEKVTSKEASGSSVTSVSSNHEELVRAFNAHASETPTTPESGRRNKCGVATSSEVTTESDAAAEPDLLSFCTSIGNSRALRVPALFKPADGDYSTVADTVGGISRTESTTSQEEEEDSDEAKGLKRSHRRPPRGQEPPARQQGHRPSRGDPDYSYARPVKKPGPPPPPLSSTESNSAEYTDGWPRAVTEEAYSRRHTLEFSEAECDHPSVKEALEPLDQLMVDLELEKIVFDTSKGGKLFTTPL
ncbi:hypothetical protein SK128_018947 [Halocaridina rubra]|uniref:Uncharacterized protein n=1 Tax=Halocaridina rubra TaxID=373956 RepID=A0AAN8X179_HALRR